MSTKGAAPTLARLPVDDIIAAIHDTLAKNPSLVLQAAPGTGKTTRVPPALLKAPYLDPKKEILVLEPRRLAAKMSARRVASELGEGVGQTVGYQFRFENMTGPKTRLRFMTEGMLMRRLITDSRLSGVSAVILDEFHERHLHSDVSLAFLKHLQATERPDLRLIVMSATLDAESLSTYLNRAPVLRADAKHYEVAIEYLPQAPAKHLEWTVKEAVATMAKRSEGDMLVFLPGMGEIRRCAGALESIAESLRLVISPLHGELSKEEQDAAIRPLSDRSQRKIILSTNVAETSLTIEGIRVVIDSGLHRMASHSWWSGVPSLKTKPISRASAIQRAGRAGRLGPGTCLRLYTRGDFEGRAMFDAPEIGRADLAQTFLELKSLGVQNPLDFPWFEKPPTSSMDASRSLLYRLGAIRSEDPSAPLTEIGRRMVQLPAHPRLARMLIEAERSGVLEDAASLAAYIMESRLEGIDALQFLEKGRMEESIWRVRSHLLSAFSEKKITTSNPSKKNKLDHLRFSILCGYPDRVAKKRSGQDPNAAQHELLLSAGGSTKIENTQTTHSHETFVVLDLQDRQGLNQARSTTQVQSLIPIESDWLIDLEPSLLREEEEPVWDEARKRVVNSARLTYDQIVLDESRVELRNDFPDGEKVAKILLKQTLGVDPARLDQMQAHEAIQALSPWVDTSDLESTLVRLSLISQHMAEEKVPDPLSGPGATARMIVQILDGKRGLSEIQEIDWKSAILSASGELAPHRLEELAPSSITLASGRRTQVRYQLNQAPWIESRLQDFIGMKQGPKILKNRVPLTLHLLAPNGRAVQVTTDLEGFWARTYPEIRTQLSRRYPRHAWPESP